MVHKTSHTVPLKRFLSLKPSVGRQDQIFKHGGVQRHCYVKMFTSYWPENKWVSNWAWQISPQMVASKEYKQDKIKMVAQDSHKCCTGNLKHYTVVIHNMPIHTFPTALFQSLYSFHQLNFLWACICVIALTYCYILYSVL